MKKSGVEPVFETWAGEPGSEVAYVVSLNLNRRHLDEGQRAMVCAKIATLRQGRPKDNPPIGVIPTQAEAAEMLNTSVRTVQRAREVIDHGVPELVAAVERGAVSVSLAEKITELPPECPNCDTALKPEPLGAGRWLCPVCARTFEALP